MHACMADWSLEPIYAAFLMEFLILRSRLLLFSGLKVGRAEALLEVLLSLIDRSYLE